MKAIILYSFIILSSILPIHNMQAQVFANVELNRKEVYVQQPFHVTITVYTKTWFTAPVEFGNLQIPNAFIVPFDKTQPGMFTIAGKQYPGIQFYYIVFPYKTGEFTVPPLEITAQSPPEGSSQARKINLKTSPQTFVVKDVPKELKEKGAWFVAKNVILHENWEPSSRQFKVGDVIKRTITIDAKGTLPQFIPDLNAQESLEGTSSYPQDPVLTDTRDGSDANGRSVQTITYLLEKAGDLAVPPVSLSFWNPYTSKIESKSTPAIKIHVDENPKLGILTTLKDSLNATVQHSSGEKQDKAPLRILGMTWYAFAGCVIAGIIILYALFRIGKRMFLAIRRKRADYLKSEAYLFKKFQRSNNSDSKSFLTTLYRWWDNFPGKTSSSVGSTLKTKGLSEESKTFNDYFEKTLHNESTAGSSKIKDSMSKLREDGKQGKADEFGDSLLNEL